MDRPTPDPDPEPQNRTLRLALIGAHIERSRFGAAMGALSHAAGMTLDYTVFDTAAQPELTFQTVLDDVRTQGFDGLTVTHPFKTLAASAATIDRSPPGMGAANTLRFLEDGAIEAHNTDYAGIIGAWQALFGDARPGHVALAGAGGVARAILRAMTDLGAERVSLWDIDPSRAQALAGTAPHIAIAVPVNESAAAVQDATGLINATPVGTYHMPGMAFEADQIGTQTWAFDAVYTPIETEFVQTSRAHGLQVLTGFDFFCHMALASFEVYAGRPADAGGMAALQALAHDLR